MIREVRTSVPRHTAGMGLSYGKRGSMSKAVSHAHHRGSWHTAPILGGW